MPPWTRIVAEGLSVDVLARPGSSKSQILRVDPRGLVIAIAAAPDRGRANAELVRFVAQLVGLPRSAVAIVKGESSRNKTIRLTTPEPAALAAKLIAVSTPGQAVPAISRRN